MNVDRARENKTRVNKTLRFLDETAERLVIEGVPKPLVRAIDQLADFLEVQAFGPKSLAKRQREPWVPRRRSTWSGRKTP